MADDRIITLRFKAENAMDMELYRKLEEEKKKLGLSMPIYVKDVLCRHFESSRKEKAEAEMNLCMERIQNIVHEELASLSAVIIGAIVGMSRHPLDNANKSDSGSQSVKKDSSLPEYSEELPEGLDSVLEQFM